MALDASKLPSNSCAILYGWQGIGKQYHVEFDQRTGDIWRLGVFATKGHGYFFTHRILWSLFWAYEHYDFHFFLKTDDDYFVCLDHLHHDIQFRKQEELLCWGWLHCNNGYTYNDEGLLIFGYDLVEEIIKRNDSLLCHPLGDQAVGLWFNEIEKEREITYFADNDRLIQDIAFFQEKDKNEHLCSKVIGVHQAYPKRMREYWELTKSRWFNREGYARIVRKTYKEYCSWPKGFDWQLMMGGWKHEPKPCWWENSTWPYLDKVKYYKGRE